jgi:hypothetical protein
MRRRPAIAASPLDTRPMKPKMMVPASRFRGGFTI